MDSVNHDNQADIIEAFSLTCRYLDDLLNIDNPYFEGMVIQYYPPEPQLTQIPKHHFWIYIFILIMDLVHLKLMISAMTDSDIVNFTFLGGDVPRRASYCL